MTNTLSRRSKSENFVKTTIAMIALCIILALSVPLSQAFTLYSPERIGFVSVKASKNNTTSLGTDAVTVADKSPIVTWAAYAPSTYTLPDTGQTKCYTDSGEIPCPGRGDAFYGQDGNYRAVQPSYRDNGDGTVSDLVTKLMWQQASDNVDRNWFNAKQYCQDLDVAGYADWRLPSRKELLSIVDAGRHGPAINPVFTEPGASYWSGTTDASYSNWVWDVSFPSGSSSSQRNYVGFTDRVRCVRGASLPSSDYVDNADGTVTDQATGLVWEKAGSADAMAWEQALAWCGKATSGGYSDWRLPNKRELEALVDDSRYAPAIDPTFTEASGYGYWSGTTDADPEYYRREVAWYVAFSAGDSSTFNKSYTCYVRCVRAAGLGHLVL